ncbi:MAG TPA: LptA/OstA family protein [Anaeromyxobacteraceae bacterium]|nr:LptA/OstA family protein [Anaeromyxobacteraceae bacterium]
MIGLALSLALALGAARAGAAPPPKGQGAAPASKSQGAGAASRSDGAPPPPTHVENTDIEYRYKDKRIFMTGRPLVKFTREDATLVCRKAVGENDDSGEIRRATCDGDVKLTRGERTVTCEHAVYEAATGKVTCRGDPVLRDGDSIVYSDLVVYEIDTDRVTLTKAKGTLVQKPGQPSPVARGGKSK